MANLRYELYKIPFGGGIDTKTDRKLIPNGKLSALENGVFTENISIKKRKGFDNLNNNIFDETNEITGSYGLMVAGKELVQFYSDKAYSHILNRDSWLDKGSALSVNLSSSIIANGLSGQSNSDFAVTDDIYVHVWEDTRGGIYGQVGDRKSDVTFLTDKQFYSGGSIPRCIVLDDKIAVTCLDQNANEIRAKVINAGDPVGSFLDSTVLITDQAYGSYDIVVSNNGPVISYIDTSGDIVTTYLLPSMNVLGISKKITLGGTGGSVTVGPCLSIDDNQDIEVTWYDSSLGLRRYFYKENLSDKNNPLDNFKYETANTLDSDTTNPVQRITAVFDTDNTASFSSFSFSKSYIFVERDHPSEDSRSVQIYTLSQMDVDSSSSLARHCGLGTKAFIDNNRAHVGIVHDSSLQSTYWFMRDDGYVWGSALRGTAGGYLDSNHLPSVSKVGNRKFSTNIVYKNKLDLEQVVNQTAGNTLISQGVTASLTSSFFSEKGIRNYDIDFESPNAFEWAHVGRTNYIAGSQPMIYDGGQPVEAGFALWPESVELTPFSGSGDVTGSVSYIFCWEYNYSKGERDISNGIPYNVLVDHGNTGVSASIPTLPWTLKSGDRGAPRLAVYRTINAGQSYYRIDDPTNPTYNSTSSFSIEYVDTKSDSDIQSAELCYLNSELGNDPFPSCQIIATGKNRMFVAGLDHDPNIVRHSKLIQNLETVKFSDFFDIKVDEAGGPISALSVMDDKLIIFKKDRIFTVVGDGPDDIGAGEFSEAQLVTSDAGCDQSRSVVMSPNGLIFKSKKGFYMLDRQLGLSYVGADVEIYNSERVAGAQLMVDRNEIRFLLESGNTLLYDYNFNSWSVHTNTAGNSSVIWQDKLAWAGSDGRVRVENQDSYKDGKSSYSLKMETNWINLGNLQNFGRVRKALLLGDFKSDHKMRVSIAYNYQEAYVDVQEFDFSDIMSDKTWGGTDTWGSDDVWGGSSDTQYQMQVWIPRPRCQSIKFKFEDISSSGEGYELNELLLEVGLLPGGMRISSEKTR